MIIPVYHGGDFLKNALRSALRLDAPAGSFEVLVSGRRDDADAAAIVADVASQAAFVLRYIGADGSRRSALLNAACREARGDILVFTDDDCILKPDWLARIGEALEGAAVPGLIGGSDELESGASTFSIALDEVLRSPFITGKLSAIRSTAATMGHPRLFNMAVSRQSALEAAGEGPDGSSWVFDERLPGHEDLDLARRVERAGGLVRLVPEVRVGHFRDTTWRGTIAWNFNLARAARALGVQRARHLLLCGYFLAVIGLSAAAFLWPAAGVALVALSAAYLIPVLSWGIFAAARRRSLLTALFFPVILVPLHLARAAGYQFG
jgi:GT2 family glycosyltransferase